MKITNASVFAAFLSIGALSPLLGCASTVVPDEGSGLEWVRITEGQSALLAILYEGKSSATTSEEAAQQCAALVQMKIGACVDAKVTGAKVSYAFTDCTNLPYGLAAASGVVEVTYELHPIKNGYFTKLTAAGSGISLAGSTFELAATVDDLEPDSSDLLPPGMVAGPHAKNLIVSATSSGTTKEGHHFSFDAIEYTFPGVLSVYADSDRCADFATTPPSLERTSGTIESQGVPWVVNVQGFRHCGTSCPVAGGFVALTDDVDGKQGNDTPRMLRFDGSSTAKLFSRWVDETEKDTIESVPFDLGCTPATK